MQRQARLDCTCFLQRRQALPTKSLTTFWLQTQASTCTASATAQKQLPMFEFRPEPPVDNAYTVPPGSIPVLDLVRCKSSRQQGTCSQKKFSQIDIASTTWIHSEPGASTTFFTQSVQPKPFEEACYSFWQGGDFIKNDEPQGNQVFCQMNECIPEVVKAMRACVKETGSSKLFSANITADDPEEMIARGKYILSQFGPLSGNCAFLVDGCVGGGTAVTCCSRKQFLHYHRAGHGSVTSSQTQLGYTAFVHTKISRVISASGIHVGTMSFGKMEGDASDKNIAYMLQDDEAHGPYPRQEFHCQVQSQKKLKPRIPNAIQAPPILQTPADKVGRCSNFTSRKTHGDPATKSFRRTRGNLRERAFYIPSLRMPEARYDG